MKKISDGRAEKNLMKHSEKSETVEGKIPYIVLTKSYSQKLSDGKVQKNLMKSSEKSKTLKNVKRKNSIKLDIR